MIDWEMVGVPTVDDVLEEFEGWFDMDTGRVSLPMSEVHGEEVFSMRGYTIEYY